MDAEPRTPMDFRWENRLLIVFDASQQAIKELNSSGEDLEERRVLFFHFEQNGLVDSNIIDEIDEKSFLKIRPQSNTGWVLIGLDGGVKAYGDQYAGLKDIFRRIDSMPMRQSEIRRKKDG